MLNYKKIVATTRKLKYHCIIGMDHNLDFLKATKHSTTQDFIDLNLSNGLFPTVTRPTRVTHNSATLIDNIMISRNLYDTCKVGIIISDISDHLPCFLVVPKLKRVKGEPEYITKRDTLDKAMKRLNKDLKGINWDLSSQDVNELFDNCHSKIQACIDANCPEKTVRVYDKQSIKEPWLTKGIIRSNKKQLSLYKKYLSHECSHDQYKLYRSTLM